MYETNDWTNKTNGRKWYLANNGKVTVWFQNEKDRDWYAEGEGQNEIETNPGRDERNVFFKERKKGVVTTEKAKKSVEEQEVVKDVTQAGSNTEVKERIKKLANELYDIYNSLP